MRRDREAVGDRTGLACATATHLAERYPALARFLTGQRPASVTRALVAPVEPAEVLAEAARLGAEWPFPAAALGDVVDRRFLTIDEARTFLETAVTGLGGAVVSGRSGKE